MAENTKDGAVSDADAKKGRASKDIEEKANEVVSEAAKNSEVEIAEAEVVDSEPVADSTEATAEGDSEKSSKEDASVEGTLTEEAEQTSKKARKPRKTRAAARKTESVKADDVMREEFSYEEFQTEIREQIENCKNELQISLEKSIKQEFSTIVKKQMRSANRRRRVGAIVRDIIILLLAAALGYCCWCLYDVRYFDWMGPKNEPVQEEPNDQKVDEPDVVVKDTRWYVNHYGYLFEDLQLGLNADNVEAYYLYSDDYKVSEIKPAYLLGMAYNKVVPVAISSTGATAGTTVAASDLRLAFEGLFGTTDYFEKTNFTHGCKKFAYLRETDSFATENGDCVVESERKIVEEIDEMYEEGSVLYVVTTAAIYDTKEASFYSFDNLFKPAVTNVSEEDLTKNQAVLNRYQYQFNKTGEKYHFSKVVKLQ